MDNNEKQTKSEKKGLKNLCILLIVIVMILLSPFAMVKIALMIEESGKVELENIEGMTLKDAREKVEKAKLNFENMGPAYNDNDIVTSQNPGGGSHTRTTFNKGDTVKVTVKTKEAIEKIEQARKEEAEKKSAISNTIINWAKIVEADNEGSVKYEKYDVFLGIKTKYGTYKKVTDKIVYRIKYKTSYENRYYYQLVSLDDENKTILKTTKLFEFTNYKGNEEGLSQEFEYAYEKTFGN